MKRLVLLLLSPLVACSASPIARDAARDPGQILFNGYAHADVDCYRCHDGDGSGTWKGPRLTGIMEKRPSKELREEIRSGPGIMPAYGRDRLSDEELDQILAWLGTLH